MPTRTGTEWGTAGGGVTGRRWAQAQRPARQEGATEDKETSFTGDGDNRLLLPICIFFTVYDERRRPNGKVH